MTTYCVSYSGPTTISGSTVTAEGALLSIVPSSTYQVRIARIEVGALVSSGASAGYQTSVYPASTPTGGITRTSLAMRSGAPASTASVKVGSYFGTGPGSTGTGPQISGTGFLVHAEDVYTPAVSDANNSTAQQFTSGYSFPFDLILSAGSTFYVLAYYYGGTITVYVYYEELRLAWTS